MNTRKISKKDMINLLEDNESMDSSFSDACLPNEEDYEC